MKIEIDKTVLQTELALLLEVTDKSGANPALEYVDLKAFDNSVDVIAADYTRQLKSNLPCRVLESGRVLANCRKLLELVKTFGNGPVIISESKSKLSVSWGRYKGNIATMGTESFPVWHDGVYESLSIPGIYFGDAIKKIENAVVQVDAEKQMIRAGARLFIGDFIEMAAFDGSWVSAVKYSKNQPRVESSEVVIPKSALSILRKISNDIATNVEFGNDGHRIYFKVGNREYATVVLDGAFALPYHKFLPKDFSSYLEVERGILLSALKRISLSSDANSKRIYLTISGNDIALEGLSGISDGHENVEVKNSSVEDAKIAFSSKALISALEAFDADTINWMPQVNPMFLWSDGGDLDVKQLVLTMEVGGRNY